MLRKNVKETMWTCANCGVMSKTLIKDAGLTFNGLELARFEINVGEQLDINVEMPEKLQPGQELNGKKISSVNLEIDPVTPLPQGLSFDGGKISGKLVSACNVFVHVLAKVTYEDQSEQTLGTSFQLFAPELKNNAPSKGGCFGSLEATMASVTLFTIAGIALLLVSKKRRVNA